MLTSIFLDYKCADLTFVRFRLLGLTSWFCIAGLKLVGVKCISPSKGDGSLTVKSYVPDEYKEILQFAAHH